MKICIETTEDGKFRVYDEAAEEVTEAPGTMVPGQMPMAGSAGGQTLATVDEALEAARQMLSGGAMQGQSDKSPEALLQGGFEKARGMPAGM